MDKEKYQKAVNNAKWFAVGLLVLSIFVLGINILGSNIRTLSIVLGISQIILIIATIKGYSKEKEYGAICGIIVSVLLILNMNIITIIFGILYLLDCVKILNYMKNN